MGETAVAGQTKRRRVTAVTLLVIGITVSALCVLLVIGSFRNDAAISKRTGRATAEVLSVAFNRTLVRFATPDSAVHIPPDGVLYPQGLEEGQLVLVEYDQDKPDLVRVAGRTGSLALMPVGTVLAVTWLVLLPILWWLRRSGPLFRQPKM
jgi:hypothetical protein